MTAWTLHVRANRPPALVKEGFSWGALLFGPFWLLAWRAWLPGLAVLALALGLSAAPPPFGLAGPAVAVLIGLTGRDLVRWSLARRGYALTQIVLANGEDAAWQRVLDRSPDLRVGTP